jgi:chitinase
MRLQRRSNRSTPRRRRLSLFRIVVGVVLLLGVSTAFVASAQRVLQVKKLAGPGPWYAPYVDVTVTPQLHFEDLSANPSNDVVLAFVVASRGGECKPTWGTYFDLDGAGKSLDLDRRIVRLRQRGGDLIVSFGGAANDELARRCDDAGLYEAYGAVIDRYQLATVDFDIEGPALADEAANVRRARAVSRLQAHARAQGRRLAVWLTLPAAGSGLSTEAVAVVDAMLKGNVDLAGVNLMTMNYGSSRRPDRDMVETTADALAAAWRQLDSAYRRVGRNPTSGAVWRKLGMTPMIGQNDEPNDRITVSDAERLFDLAERVGLGRMSIWSLNRDQKCGAQLDLGIVSNLCSGVQQKTLAFTYLFDRLPGRSTHAASAVALPSTTGTRDNPATSPYAIWTETGVYKAGDKVTWRRNVYEAKWWSHSDVPDEPVVHEWDTPWRFLGPVLPGDRPPPPLPVGTYPQWLSSRVYVKGDRVQVGTTAYEAKWWTRGERPDATVVQAWDLPWEELDPRKVRRPVATASLAEGAMRVDRWSAGRSAVWPGGR